MKQESTEIVGENAESIRFTVKRIDSAFIYVWTDDPARRKDLYDYFTFFDPKYKNMPVYLKRTKKWDGKIRLYNKSTGRIYAGLYPHVMKFCKDRDIPVDDYIKEGFREELTREEIRTFINDHLKPTAYNKPIEILDHQLEGVYHGFNGKNRILLSSTGSGKSFILYSLIRMAQLELKEDEKILLIVPNVALVNQMYSDFQDYASQSKWKCHKNVHRIYEGQEHETKCPIVISTWQSIYEYGYDFFDQFKAVFVDEVHLAKAKSLTDIMKKCRVAEYRIGVTGTLDELPVHRLILEGLFGRVKTISTNSELIEKEILSDIDIKCFELQYPTSICKRIKKEKKYQAEIDFIVSNQERNEFIVDLADQLKGNTLILFQFVQKHGKILYQLLNRQSKKEIYFICGEVEATLREQIRKICETKSNCIIVASYGTCSTGISIRRLNNIILASPVKGVIRLLQSLGRGLRKSEHKDKLRVYDIGDNLSYLSWVNSTFKHLKIRLDIYKKEKFKYKVYPIKMEKEL